MRPPPSQALLVHPRFSHDSFWNYHETCAVAGARYPSAPLGLITVAALLPPDWTVRLVDRNIEALRDEDLAWADLVLTGGMLPQQLDTKAVIAEAHRHGKPVVIGGPDVTCSPGVYEEAEFRVLGEAEEILAEFLEAWNRGEKSGLFEVREFPDLSCSPVPRFDLLKMSHYMHVGVQRSRGCPFNCEFCNVIELNGRRPRAKSTAQVLRELEALRSLGYRGHVDFVDDNLVGDPASVKQFLRDLGGWQATHDHPFEFTTEVSLNAADSPELLDLMGNAGFFAVFVGIETPDREILLQNSKGQNARGSIPERVRRFYRAGMFVNAGFIIGFDGELGDVAPAMIRCIEESSIPVCMVGLLYALPNTRLSRRLALEGRLWADSDRLQGIEAADQCSSGLNFDTIRSRRAILEDYRTVLESIYSPEAYFARVRGVAGEIDLSRNRHRLPARRLPRNLLSLTRILWRVGLLDRRSRGPFRRALRETVRHNPAALRTVFSLAALYLHYGVFARRMDARLGTEIGNLGGGFASRDTGLTGTLGPHGPTRPGPGGGPGGSSRRPGRSRRGSGPSP